MKFVTVYRATNEVEAMMVRNFLNKQNIRTNIMSHLPSSVYGLAVQDLKVQVDENEKDWALRLIDAYFLVGSEVSIDRSDIP